MMSQPDKREPLDLRERELSNSHRPQWSACILGSGSSEELWEASSRAGGEKLDGSAFIWILEHGREKGLGGTKPEDAEKLAIEAGVLAAPDSGGYREERRAFLKLFHESFERTDRTKDTAFVLKSEYFFRLLEHDELVASRDAASSARSWAAGALVVSILAILVSAAIGYAELATPIQIEGEVRLNQDALDQLAALNPLHADPDE